MDAVRKIVEFGEDLLRGGASVMKWLVSPIFEFDFSLQAFGISIPFLNFGGFKGSFSPLLLLSITGLIFYINVAFWKWLLK